MSDSLLFKIFPQGVNTTALEKGYELHKAAGAVQRTLADDSVDKNLTSQLTEQRRILLQLGIQLIVSKRNQYLDDFAQSWIKHRSANANSS